MAWVADADLAASVSNAGGLGIIAAGNAPGDFVRGQIAKAKEMTSKPFGVNIMLMSPFAEEVAQVVAEEKVAVVTTGAGNPSKHMKLWNEAGIKVIPVIPSTGIARMVERNGAFAVIAEGGESGGHVGEITTMSLVPQVVDSVGIPVLAAGGIGDGRGIAASFMLGAVGVQVGTRFLVARECSIHQNYKNKILKARDIDTITTGKRLGHPVRSLKTAFSREFFTKEYDSSISNEELEAFGTGALRLAVVEGDDKKGCFLAGQIAGMIKTEQTSKEIIEEMFTEAEAVLRGAGRWVK
jgi:enoyl-[acyl-carrier protein] reductase II